MMYVSSLPGGRFLHLRLGLAGNHRGDGGPQRRVDGVDGAPVDPLDLRRLRHPRRGRGPGEHRSAAALRHHDQSPERHRHRRGHPDPPHLLSLRREEGAALDPHLWMGLAPRRPRDHRSRQTRRGGAQPGAGGAADRGWRERHHLPGRNPQQDGSSPALQERRLPSGHPGAGPDPSRHDLGHAGDHAQALAAGRERHRQGRLRQADPHRRAQHRRPRRV